MTHPFLEKLARELGEAGVATFRYQFPYMEQRRRAPDSPSVAMATVAAAVRAAAMAAAGLPLLAGGKSFRGRRSSPAASPGRFGGVPRPVFFWFSRPSADDPGSDRAVHVG